MLRYEQFHRQHRFLPDSQYLIYTCRASMPGTNRHCLGVGDRFRLIGFMLRVAAAFERVLLVDWQSPMPINVFFAPKTIDWRLNESERLQTTGLRVHRWLGHLHAPLPSDRYLRVTGNAPYESQFPGSSDFFAPPFSTAWNFLFEPSEQLQQAVHARRTALFGSKRYIGLHIRMGDRAPGTAFDPITVPRRDTRLTHDEAAHIVQCVKAEHAGQPVFLATDNAALKSAVQHPTASSLAGASLASTGASIFKDVFVQGCTACMVNPVFLHEFPNASVEDIFVELLLLARSSCFYFLPSNFANLVRAIRGVQACSIVSKKRCASLGSSPR